MRVYYLQKPKGTWFKKVPKSKEYPRHFITLVDIEVILSDKSELKIKKGTIWDGASVPKWLHWLFKPTDEAALADFIHDELWKRKEEQLKKFGYNSYKARLFADVERDEWRWALAPKKWVFNLVSHFVIRLIGGFYYSRQFKIPN